VAAKKEKGCKNPHTSEKYWGVSPIQVKVNSGDERRF
jgi:hypothetical protein